MDFNQKHTKIMIENASQGHKLYIQEFLNTYPELASESVLQALREFTSKTEFNITDLQLIQPLTQSRPVKEFISLPVNNPDYNQRKNILEIYFETVAKAVGAKQPRVFQQKIFQLLSIVVKPQDTYQPLISKVSANVVLKQPSDNKEITVYADIDNLIKIDNNTNHAIKSTNAEMYKYLPGKMRLNLNSGIITQLISCTVALQNTMRVMDYNNRIKTKGFLPIPSSH